MSGSVGRTEVFPVPVCPTGQPNQRFHPLKETITPLGRHALSCEILRWLFHCFLVNTVVFLPAVAAVAAVAVGDAVADALAVVVAVAVAVVAVAAGVANHGAARVRSSVYASACPHQTRGGLCTVRRYYPRRSEQG
jgi:hypothetical protein